MTRRRPSARTLAPATAALAAIAVIAATGSAGGPQPRLFGVPKAAGRATGYAPASRLAPALRQAVWAQGSTRLENPRGSLSFYGYANDVVSPDDPTRPQMVPTTSAGGQEAKKTEPDKNTYLRFPGGLHGPGAAYDYGTEFLYQGHEGVGQLTRINLDADARHRVTLMATRDTAGNPLAAIDGSTWDPWARRLILTTENAGAPTYAASADYPSKVTDVSGALGRGGYEGVQNDSDGNLWIVEDTGGASKGGTRAKRPNSFLYRYVPRQRGDLHHGRLEALQVLDRAGQPITFESQAPIGNSGQMQLHAYGNRLGTRWVEVHDTATDGNAPFDANAAAKAAQATPFKRPENGSFRPGSGFREFYFAETGDTDPASPENPAGGGWGGIQKLVQPRPSAPTGTLTLFFRGDRRHTGLDNTTFVSADLLASAEDAGEVVHEQRDGLDSGFLFDTTHNYAGGKLRPGRWLAQGRDPSATIDAANGGFGKNAGDNEITGVLVSDGDPTPGGILGAKNPTPFTGPWRWFYTQQHGDNVTYELIPARG